MGCHIDIKATNEFQSLIINSNRAAQQVKTLVRKSKQVLVDVIINPDCAEHFPIAKTVAIDKINDMVARAESFGIFVTDKLPNCGDFRLFIGNTSEGIEWNACQTCKGLGETYNGSKCNDCNGKGTID